MPTKKKPVKKKQNKIKSKARIQHARKSEDGVIHSPWSPITTPELEFSITNKSNSPQLQVRYNGGLFYTSSTNAEKTDTVSVKLENSLSSDIHFKVAKTSSNEFYITNLICPGLATTLEVRIQEDSR